MATAPDYKNIISSSETGFYEMFLMRRKGWTGREGGGRVDRLCSVVLWSVGMALFVEKCNISRGIRCSSLSCCVLVFIPLPHLPLCPFLFARSGGATVSVCHQSSDDW